MTALELNPEQADVLREVLQHYTTEMDVEVFRTDTHNFKEQLKHKRGLLLDVLAKLTRTEQVDDSVASSI